jgi:hypothetical protein
MGSAMSGLSTLGLSLPAKKKNKLLRWCGFNLPDMYVMPKEVTID